MPGVHNSPKRTAARRAWLQPLSRIEEAANLLFVSCVQGTPRAMPFSEQVRLAVKKKANFTCCWCQDRAKKVHVHHIKPQSQSGPDTKDNAAPLCGSCHDLYGNNPDLMKEVRYRRDHWYETCP